MNYFKIFVCARRGGGGRSENKDDCVWVGGVVVSLDKDKRHVTSICYNAPEIILGSRCTVH